MDDNLLDAIEMTQAWYKGCVNDKELPSPVCHCCLLSKGSDSWTRRKGQEMTVWLLVLQLSNTSSHWPLVTPIHKHSLIHSRVTVQLWALAITCFCSPVQPTSAAYSLPRHRVSTWRSFSCLVCQAPRYKSRVLVPHLIRTTGVSLTLSVKTFHTHVVPTPLGVIV